MKKYFKMFFSLIGAFLIFAILSQLLIFLGPIIAGLFISALEIPANPQLAKTMESIGNIFVFFISIYAGIRTYKKFNGKQSDTVENNENKNT